MEIKWTADQQKAIESRRGTVLVSAAAGSGKTAVLVERVIQRICDESDPCGVENLLIVTFTNAAAAQMKEKIAAALSKRIADDPADKRLRRQQLMLPFASICTIDSFCINLVRENFHELGVSPDFSLLDNGRIDILMDQAVNSVIEERHKSPTPEFISLCDLISDTKDDKKLIEAVLKLYKLSQAYPFPERWLDSLSEEFSSPRSVEESSWGKILINHTIQSVCSFRAGAEHCIKLLSGEPELEAKYAPAFHDDINSFDHLLDALSGESWDGIREAYDKVEFSRMNSAPKGYSSAVKDTCGNTRDNYKKKFKQLKVIFSISSEDHGADIARLAPVVTGLIGLVKEFAEKFRELKLDENGADFSDTLHLALELLAEPDGDGYRRTPLAAELSENYREILVDEYQDVNKAQDMIFSALSRDETNLFMVGDVKQSIYRFRQAMPEIFLGRRDGLKEYTPGNYPAKITLGQNFRSRSGVTGTVNFIFSSLMSREAGGLEYDENEYLQAGAKYPEKNEPDAELYLIECEKDNSGSAQAEFAADYIAKSMAGGLKISDGDGFRAPRYKDFCILLRSVSGSSADYIRALTDRGIPVISEASEGFLTSPEIMFMVSLLKVINNPVDDIPLTAVMLSPVFGFTPDDLALMRSAHRSGNIYHALSAYAESGDEKSRAFLERLTELRRLSATLRTGELVRRLVNESGYGSIINAGGDSAKRRSNLNRFIDLANRNEASSKGVSGFIRYIDRIIKSGKDIEGGKTASDAADAVTVMTIHKSKGLEFPVCILGACERTFNANSLSDELIIAQESGIGIKVNDGVAKYDTLPRLAASVETRAAEHSEELRILYVALTRAKEKLVMLCSCRNAQKTVSLASTNLREEKLIDPYNVINFTSYADGIIASLLRHPDAEELRSAAGLPVSITLPCDSRLLAKIIHHDAAEAEEKPEAILPEADHGETDEIRRRAEFVYPYSGLSGIVSKRIASNLESENICGEYYASKKPSFMSKDKLSPAQRGTATHRFMQFSDYAKASVSVASELERLVDGGMLTQTEAESVDKNAIEAFFRSELASRMLASEKIYKEYAFTASFPLSEMYPDVPAEQSSGEVIIVEGVADCAFVEDGSLVIVDYKTDRASDGEELAEKYADQLSVYRRCLGETIGLPVKETLIYSFRLGITIEV